MKMIRFPGDDPVVAYPMFDQEFGGDPARATVQLHVSKISPERAVALVGMWHIKPINPLIFHRGGAVAYGSEYNNRFYAVAVWAPKRDGATLIRIASAVDTPPNTIPHLLQVSSNLAVEEFDPVELTSRETLPADLYESQGWEKKQVRQMVSWARVVRERPPAADRLEEQRKLFLENSPF